MLSFLGFIDLRTGNIVIGLLSVLQCIGIILAGSASYVEADTMMCNFHLVWIGMSAVLLIASLSFLKGVGDKLPNFVLPWIVAIVPYILWILGAGIWAALYSSKKKQKRHKPTSCRRILTSLEEEAAEEDLTTSAPTRVPYRIKPLPKDRTAPSSSRSTKQEMSATSSKASNQAVETRRVNSTENAMGRTTLTLPREERLRLQKLKQEEFRRKYQEQQKQKAAGPQNWIVTPNKCSSSGLLEGAKRGEMPQGGMMVIMDTKAIAACPVLVSALRRQPGVSLEVRSLSAGDFQLSHRTGGARWAVEVLADTQGHQGLVEEVRHLYDLYDRPCIVLESDPGSEGHSFKRSKHFCTTLLRLASTHAKILLSHSQENTADLLATLARQEHRKGTAIPVPPNLKDIEEVIPFYAALPRVNLGVAISLAAGYRSVAEFLRSSAEEIQRIGKVCERRAKEIADFCNEPGCF